MKKRTLDYFLKIRLPIIIFTILTTFTITYFISRPERDGIGYAPEQPIKFSHKLHAGDMRIDCKYCHIGTEKGRHALVPSTNICMNCHTIARKDKPEIIKLTKYFTEGKPIPWKRIHKVPDYAYFNHSVHVNKNIDCQNCHGKIENLETVEQVKSWTMATCLNCHKDPHANVSQKIELNKGPEYCSACHR